MGDKCSLRLFLVLILPLSDFLIEPCEVKIVELNSPASIRAEEPLIVDPLDPGQVVVVGQVKLGQLK